MNTTIRWMPAASLALLMTLPAVASAGVAVNVEAAMPHQVLDQSAELPVDRAVERLRLERDARLQREAQRALAQLRSEVESALASGAGNGDGLSVNAAR
jgi:hypothetical protein